MYVIVVQLTVPQADKSTSVSSVEDRSIDYIPMPNLLNNIQHTKLLFRLKHTNIISNSALSKSSYFCESLDKTPLLYLQFL